MCYNFFNKNCIEKLLRHRIFSRGTAQAAGPRRSGRFYSAEIMQHTSPFRAAAGPELSTKAVFFLFHFKFVAILYIEMYNYKISQKRPEELLWTDGGKTFL